MKTSPNYRSQKPLATHEIIQITRHGHPSAVLMSADDLESLQETIHWLSRPGIREDLGPGTPRHRRRQHDQRGRPAPPIRTAAAVTGTEPDDTAAWKVEVTSVALTSLRRLPGKAAAAVVEFVTGPLADNSRRLSKPLTNELLGLHTARRGDYRVLFNLDVEDHILYVYRIEHRSDVYKPR